MSGWEELRAEIEARHVEGPWPRYRGKPRLGSQCLHCNQKWPCDAARLAAIVRATLSGSTAPLDEAWREAEAALPEGDYRTLVLSGYLCKPEGCGLDYNACVEGPIGEILEESAGRGAATPAEALHALTARLAAFPDPAPGDAE